ncbi:MAG: molecular chaperone [Planctomycetota bacterium]
MIDESTFLKEILPGLFLTAPDNDITITNVVSFIKPQYFPSMILENSMTLEIQKEFTRFFRVCGEDYLPPYESCWVLKKFHDEPFLVRRLYSKTTNEIQEIYNNLQISPHSNFFEPPDHIAFELSVYFTVKESEYTNEYIQTFIKDHFEKWVPFYLHELSNKNGIFYPVIAKYLLNKI